MFFATVLAVESSAVTAVPLSTAAAPPVPRAWAVRGSVRNVTVLSRVCAVRLPTAAVFTVVSAPTRGTPARRERMHQ